MEDFPLFYQVNSLMWGGCRAAFLSPGGRKDETMYYLTAEAAFDSAHFLNGYEGKCANLHGHRWRVVAKVGGEKLQESGEKVGMLLDFSDLKRELRALAETLDHKLIVEKYSLQLSTMDAMEAEGFEVVELPFRPTAENLARHLYQEMEKLGFPMVSMTVYETPDNCAVYEEGRL